MHLKKKIITAFIVIRRWLPHASNTSFSPGVNTYILCFSLCKLGADKKNNAYVTASATDVINA